eukprot:6459200-Amphidinium_carterae.1
METPGQYIAAKLVTLAEATAGPLTKQASDVGDPRLLGELQYEVNGARGVEFSQAVQQMRQEELPGWPIMRDRTALWLCKYIYQHGGTPDGRQTRWATEQRIDSNNHAYIVHDLVGYALEVSLTWDQLDISNLACMEVLSRLYQLIEESSDTMKVEGLEHWIGRDKTSAG